MFTEWVPLEEIEYEEDWWKHRSKKLLTGMWYSKRTLLFLTYFRNTDWEEYNKRMTRNPFLNALSASLYIMLVTLMMSAGEKLAPKQDNIVMPMVFISVFTFSVATMAYVFGYHPFQMYFDGKRREAATLFLRSLIIFGSITLILAVISFSGLF